MKILVIGGMHGNEPLGIALAKKLQNQPLKDISAVLANKQAIDQNCRYTNADLNRSFPGGQTAKDYEQRRANELLKLCNQYDVVFDFHNTHCPDNDCSFVGSTANQNLYDISAWLGLNRVIVADYDCINKYAPNCLSIEISLNSPKMSTDSWYKKLDELSKLQTIPKATNIKKYQFVYRMTIADKNSLNLSSKNLQAFKPISKKLATAMNISSPAYPLFINDAYTPYNYGGLLNKID